LLDSADGGPATTDLGLFPAAFSGLEYPQEEPVPVGAYAAPAGEEYAEHAARVAAARGRHRRRRRSLVVAAAAVAASALAAGAVAVTGQVMGDEAHTDRALLPDRSASMPDVELPTQAAGASGTATTSMPRQVPASSSTTASASDSALPGTPGGTGPSASPSPATVTDVSNTADPLLPSVPAVPSDPSVPSDPTVPSTDVPGLPTTSPSPLAPTVPAPPTPSAPVHTADPGKPALGVLHLGDTGPAVVLLQQQLADVWVYHGRADGDFDPGVARAVTLFQIWYGVRGDEPGVYGPYTRSALEHQTS
jgi:hypothetical protein